MRRREEKGMLGGMMEFPGTAWDKPETSAGEAGIASFVCEIPSGQKLAEVVRHSFTHFNLELEVCRVETDQDLALPPGYRWVKPEDVKGLALPTLMRKVVGVVN